MVAVVFFFFFRRKLPQFCEIFFFTSEIKEPMIVIRGKALHN